MPQKISNVPYGPSWDGSMDAPTQNAVYDKVQSIGVGADFSGMINAANYPNLQAAADVAFGPISAPHGTANVTGNKVLFIPNGIWLPPIPGAPVLDLKYLHGGRILGAGRFVTKLRQNVDGVPTIRTNGCGYSHFEGFMMEGGPQGTLFDLDWDGTAGGAALQSVTFTDLEFAYSKFGLLIASSAHQGDTMAIHNCFFIGQSEAGLMAATFNTLGIQVFGGDFQGCKRGIWCGAGAVETIHGPSFQQSSECDILISGGASYNCYSIKGVSSESQNFIVNDGGLNLDIAGCTHRPSVDGTFLRQVGGIANLRVCRSTKGVITSKYWAQMGIANCGFDKNYADVILYEQPWAMPHNSFNTCTEIENTWFGDQEIRRRRNIGFLPPDSPLPPEQAIIIKSYDYNVTEVA